MKENIERIGTTYSDMIEQIQKNPKDENELVQLKNFLAENEVNLCKIVVLN